MSFPANVVNVMIASPGDVADARLAVYDALNGWNDANAQHRGIVLLPLRWETSAVPETGAHPQDIINHQLVERADIVIAMFGSRVGAETQRALSGTVEEIDGASAAGKPVHVFFSTAPLPNDVDVEQLQALRGFKNEFEKRGLYGSFATPSELTTKVWQAVEADLTALGIASARVLAEPTGAVLRVQPRGSGFNLWLEIRNDSPNVDAENVTVTSINDHVKLLDRQFPKTIHAGTSRDYRYSFEGPALFEPRLKLDWIEHGEQKTREFII